MAKPPLHLDSGDLSHLMNLIDRLEQTDPMTDEEIWEAQSNKAASLSGGSLGHFFRTNDGPAVMGQYQNDLGIMVRFVSMVFDDWLNFGIWMAPAYARRVGIILGKAKRLELRARFDAAIARHPYSRVSMLVPPEVHAERVRLQSLVPRLKITCDRIDKDGDAPQMHFSFCCEDCGGWMLSAPQDDDPNGPIICKACDQVLGLRKDMEALARHIGQATIAATGTAVRLGG